MTRSVNTVFYKMGIDAGPQRVADAAHQAGIPADQAGRILMRTPASVRTGGPFV